MSKLYSFLYAVVNSLFCVSASLISVGALFGMKDLLEFVLLHYGLPFFFCVFGAFVFVVALVLILIFGLFGCLASSQPSESSESSESLESSELSEFLD